MVSSEDSETDPVKPSWLYVWRGDEIFNLSAERGEISYAVAIEELWNWGTDVTEFFIHFEQKIMRAFALN